MAWLAEALPEREVAIRVIHDDFRFDNVVLDPADPFTVIGVLDWEMATLGDPLMDLGNSLAYWVQADDDEYFRMTRRQPTDAPGMLTRAEVVAHYAARTGLAGRGLRVLRGLRALPRGRDRAADLAPLPRGAHEGSAVRRLRPARQLSRRALPAPRRRFERGA